MAFDARRTGTVVVVPYMYSDLSKVEPRPAVVIAPVGRRDWLLCQLTTNPLSDNLAVELNNSSLETGTLFYTSYARPGKLFTAEEGIISRTVGRLRADVFNGLIDSIVNLMNQNRMRQ